MKNKILKIWDELEPWDKAVFTASLGVLMVVCLIIVGTYILIGIR